MNRLPARFALIVAAVFAACAPTAWVAADLPTTLPSPGNGALDRAAEMPAIRADFLKLIDRPRVALDPESQSPTTAQNLVEIRFSYVSETGQRVPGILVMPSGAAGRLPTVIALHGTGGNKADQLPFLRQLANRGFGAIAIDGRYHGDRARGVALIAPMNAYETEIFHVFEGESHEHPLYYDTVWDVMRLIDYLQTRDDVDPNHIGIYGVSKGGIEAYLAAAVDPRIAVAVPTIGVQTFEWGLDHNDWQVRVGTFQKAFNAAAKAAGVATPDSNFTRTFYDKLMPGIDGEFDGPSILPLIAPRPLLMINSDNDHHTPIAGVNLAADAARAAFHRAGLDDHFAVTIQHNAGHKVLPVSQRQAVEFFTKWLMPGGGGK